jgi:hypothetical protein
LFARFPVTFPVTFPFIVFDDAGFLRVSNLMASRCYLFALYYAELRKWLMGALCVAMGSTLILIAIVLADENRGQRAAPAGHSVQLEAELRDKGRAAPVGGKALRICHCGLSAKRRVGISGKDKTIFLRKIRVVVAQIQTKDLPLENDSCVPVEIAGSANPPNAAD